MAGTVHEVENHALLAEVEREAANAAQELVEAARLHRGQIVVIGCSTSEVVGHQVDDVGHVVPGQGLVEHDLVQTVQELRAEGALQQFVHLILGLLADLAARSS